MVTLSDVARAAGVSLSTASRAINGSKDRTVNPDLRDRVLAAAEKLQYSPNAAAQAMARGRTTTIGLIVHDITDPYFSSIAAGVAAAAREADHVVTLATTGHDRAELVRVVDVMRMQRAAGLVIAGGLWDDETSLARMRSAIEQFRDASRGNVALVAQPLLGVSTIVPENHAGAADLAKALVAEGFERFVILAGPEGHLTARDRVTGFTEGLAGRECRLVTGSFDRDGGYAAMSEVLAAGDLPDVVFAVNDVMAVGALAAARDAGVDVPGQIAVAGFDDIPTLRDVTPALTTVRVPLVEMGRRAAALALAPHTDEPEVIELPTETVLRASTARTTS